MNVTNDEIKKLREATGAGMMDAKKALQEAANFDEAVTLLRKKGHATLAKKATRTANQGIIVSYIHAGNKVGALLELNCETDFVARNTDFIELANEVALHVAAAAPTFLKREDVPAEIVEAERKIYMEQVN